MSFTPGSRRGRYLLPCAAALLFWVGCIHGAIASIPGLVRNMWSLDPDSGLGTSIYLFDSETAARRFLAEPTLEHLINGPEVSGVSFDLTQVDGEHAEHAPSLAAAPADSRAAS
jgi:hypothetical protein